MNILVTGSNGFVGTQLMHKLANLGHSVVGIDISKHCDATPHEHTQIGDIRNIEDLEKVHESFYDRCHENIDIIIHCAASKHDFGITEPEYYSHNEEGTRVVLDYAKERKINKIIYYSTVSVFGHPSERTDEDGEFNPDHPYGASKLAGEKLCREWQKNSPEAELIVLRPTVIYGPHNYANMYKMIDMMHRHPIVTIGSGDYIKSIVSINNMIDMTLFAMSILSLGAQIYNCVDKPYITVRQLMELIASHDKFRIPPVKIPVALAVLIGGIFDLPAKLFKIDLPVNSDRMKKFSTPTDFASERIREKGYVQKYSIEDEIAKLTDWYISIHKKA